jgi:putative ABC transport system permease protein
MRAWLAALRIARREARRTRGRSLLVIALIGLPVLGLSMGAATYQTSQLTADERANRLMGTGDAVVIWPFDGRVQQDPTDTNFFFRNHTDAEYNEYKESTTMDEVVAALPKGSRAISDVRGSYSFRTATGRGSLETRALDYGDPLARGILTPSKGRAPRGADEVSVSTEAAKRIGAELGGTLEAADGSRSWRIVGLIEDPSAIHKQVVVFQPGALNGGDGRSLTQGSRWIVDTPAAMTWPEVRKLNLVGIVAISREVLRNPPPASEVEFDTNPGGGTNFAVGTLVGGLLILEVVLLAGPAFAVGARRRRRELALVAATGGTPAHLRRIMLADGVILGAAAAVIGIVFGLLAAYAGRPLVEEYITEQRAGAFQPYPEALVVVATLAVMSGVLAALVPAWLASRQPVVAALSGRYGATRLRRRWAVAGAAMLLCGVAATAYGASQSSVGVTLVGLVLGELGLVLCTPAVVGLVSRLGGRLPFAPRLALRDIGRNRAAAAPAISAVLAAVAISGMIATMLASDHGRAASSTPGVVPDGYATAAVAGTGAATPEGIAAMEAAFRSTLPVTTVTPYSTPACASGTPGYCNVDTVLPQERRCPFSESNSEQLTKAQQRAALQDPRCNSKNAGRTSYGDGGVSDVVIEPGLLPNFAKLDPDTTAKASAILRAGGVLVDSADYVLDGNVTLKITNYREVRGGDRKGDERTVTVPGFAMPDGIDSPSLIMSPVTIQKLTLTSTLTGIVGATSRAPSQAEIDKLDAAVPAVGDRWHAGVQRRDQQKPRTDLIILAIVAGLITLGAASIATGLAAADSRADLATLAAVGASPGVRRLLSLSQTGLIAGLGSALGIAAGVGAATAMITGMNAAGADKWPATDAMPIVVPWLNVGIALVVVPAVAMLGAGLLTRSRLPIERRA